MEWFTAVTLALLAIVPWAARLVFASGRWSARGAPAKAGVLKPGKGASDTTCDSKGCAVLCNAAPCMPLGMVTVSNAPKATHFDSGLTKGSFIFFHQPTDDADSFNSGSYLHAEHMHGRKRLWEFRVQISVTEKISGDLFLGCEQDCYYPISRFQRVLGDSVVSAVKRGAGADGMHQSHGDDPATTKGECERPQLVFPLRIMDQLIVTPEGEQPPSLTDPAFASMGTKKTDDRKAMREMIENLELVPGKTYTIGFWCIAQFVDAIAWCSRAPTFGLIPEVTLSELGTHPPAYVTIYQLKPRSRWEGEPDKRDARHLDSRKNYLWRVALWSSYLPPKPRRLQELLGMDKLTGNDLLEKQKGVATGFGKKSYSGQCQAFKVVLWTGVSKLW